MTRILCARLPHPAGSAVPVAAALGRLTPAVEVAGGELYCELAGRHAAFEGERAWAAAIARELLAVLAGEMPSVGIAGSCLVARLAAERSGPRRIRRVAAGEEAMFLAPLPLGVLEIDARVLARLRALGIELVGDLARLSLADLQRQFAGEGPRLFRLARGEDGRRVTPARPPRTWCERLVLEGASGDLAVLRPSVCRCAQLLGERLRGAGLVGGRVALVLEPEDGGEEAAGTGPPQPVGNGDELSAVALGLLARAAVPGPVAAVRLELSGLRPVSGRQVDVWRRGDASREAVATTTTRLRTRFGEAAVRRPRLVRDPGDLAERRFTWEGGP